METQGSQMSLRPKETAHRVIFGQKRERNDEKPGKSPQTHKIV
jgi:hypothetical protein